MNSDKDHQTPFEGGSNMRTTNPVSWTTAILKKDKSSCLRNGLTNRHEIWHGDAYWPSPLCRGNGNNGLTNRHKIWNSDALVVLFIPDFSVSVFLLTFIVLHLRSYVKCRMMMKMMI